MALFDVIPRSQAPYPLLPSLQASTASNKQEEITQL